MEKSPIVVRINTLLAKKDITKAEFYEKCGVTSASFSQWNTGKSKPRLKNIERIAKFLGVSSEYLLYGEESPAQDIKKARPADGEALSDMQLEAIEFVKSLPEDKLNRFLRLAKAAFEEDGK